MPKFEGFGLVGSNNAARLDANWPGAKGPGAKGPGAKRRGARALVAARAAPRGLIFAAAAALAGMAACLTPTPADAGVYGPRGGIVHVGYGRGYGVYRGGYARGFYGPRFGRGFYGPRFRRGFYGPRFVGYGGRGFYGRGYRRGRLSGAEAAIISAGIIGGVILIDRALEGRYDRRFDDRRYSGGFPGESERWSDLAERRRFLDRAEAELRREERALDEARRDFEDDRDAFDRDRDARDRDRRDRDERDFAPRPRAVPTDPVEQRPLDNRPLDDELDGRLLGAPTTATLDAAFATCVSETRAEVRSAEMFVAFPAAPASRREISPGVVRMSAAFTAESADGQSFRRLMLCDADAEGVRRLEIIA